MRILIWALNGPFLYATNRLQQGTPSRANGAWGCWTLTPALPGALAANPAPLALLQDVGQGVVITRPVPGFTDFLPQPHNPGGRSVLGLHAEKPGEPGCSLGLTQGQGPHAAGRVSKPRPGSNAGQWAAGSSPFQPLMVNAPLLRVYVPARNTTMHVFLKPASSVTYSRDQTEPSPEVLPRPVTRSTARWVLVPPVCGVEEPLKLLSYNPNPRPGSGSLP